MKLTLIPTLERPAPLALPDSPFHGVPTWSRSELADTRDLAAADRRQLAPSFVLAFAWKAVRPLLPLRLALPSTPPIWGARDCRSHYVCLAAARRPWLELRAMISTRSDHVFIGGSGRHEGHPLTRSAVYKIFGKLRVVAGLPKGTRLNPHTFRHGFALKSLDNGARIDEVSQMMGHSSVAVTIDYYGQRDIKYLSVVHQRTSPTRQVKPSDFKVESKRK